MNTLKFHSPQQFNRPAFIGRAAAVLSLLLLSVAALTGAASGGEGAAGAGLLPLPARSEGAARSLTMLYRDPDTHSPVLRLFTPGGRLALLGSTPDGHYFAVAGAASPEALQGYVLASEVQTEYRSGHSRSTAMVYRRASTAGPVATVLPPLQSFELLGRSPAGDWIAVSGQGPGAFAGWMPAGEVESRGSLRHLPVFPNHSR